MWSAYTRTAAAPTPRVLWIELTSKCPFDCVFCSRKLRRGAGQHLPFAVYEKLVAGLADVRTLVLNYSGESTYYPDLIPAIRVARDAGAWVELVSAFASATPEMTRELAASGLNRLTVSVHTMESAQFSEIYRYSSLAALKARLHELMSHPDRPAVDFGFVAMDSNLDQLGSVGTFAQTIGVADVLIFPVMRRDPIAAEFVTELNSSGEHRPDFRARLARAVDHARTREAGLRFTVCTPGFNGDTPQLGAVPKPYPWPLPEGACIHSCDQNPFETAHVLSNGDVVPCEVLDRRVMGNLLTSTIDEIWTSDSYSEFRRQYRAGGIAECRTCAWKSAFVPGPLAGEIIGSRGRSSQLLYGWHEPANEEVIWSTQRAAAVLRPRRGSRFLHVSGMLPPARAAEPNALTIRCNGREIDTVENPWGETIPFGLNFAVEGGADEWLLEFRTRFAFRPSEHGAGSDNRDLGFALMLLASKPAPRVANAAAIAPLRRMIRFVDRAGRMRKRRGARFGEPESGVSIIIPERDNPEHLAHCLTSVETAIHGINEGVEIIVAANGSPRVRYSHLSDRARWLFCDAPLGFSAAVGRGVRTARYGWVYLLNNDAELDAHALRAVLELRRADVFAVASQIFLRDATRFREETNLTELRLENGVVTVHDVIPASASPVETFYAGGGASLFQRRLLLRLLTDAYDPFYWEDVEWGWRSRKLGYRALFCPASIAHHTQRGTISRHFTPDDIELILERNRLLFQLRNMTESGSTEAVLDEVSRLPPETVDWFRRPRVLAGIAASRLWNLRAPLFDDRVLSS
ncbi:MAG TPA: SPASM domain-containing protein [Bryobacteraceae bacterium]|nr:SPASM domain-containing protein [Bryobacteraceae bacterium]